MTGVDVEFSEKRGKGGLIETYSVSQTISQLNEKVLARYNIEKKKRQVMLASSLQRILLRPKQENSQNTLLSRSGWTLKPR